jgi:hypothetical protein
MESAGLHSFLVGLFQVAVQSYQPAMAVFLDEEYSDGLAAV